MKKSILTILVATLFVSCSAKNENSTNNVVAATPSEVKVEPRQQQTSALEDYLALKELLVKSDAQGAVEAAKKLKESVKREKLDATMIAAAVGIASFPDLKAQRGYFKTITDKMIETLKANGSSKTVYVQHCPMAFNNTGANWISDSKEVLNPYFGDKMLRCGRVTEEIKN